MSNRIAAGMALVVFAICLVVGRFQAQNSFATTVTRALLAMLVTLVIGLIIGAMAQRMLEENLKNEEEKRKNISTSPGQGDR
jgi:NhaP-type Na+/H+ or K+/H+ antiporter